MIFSPPRTIFSPDPPLTLVRQPTRIPGCRQGIFAGEQRCGSGQLRTRMADHFGGGARLLPSRMFPRPTTSASRDRPPDGRVSQRRWPHRIRRDRPTAKLIMRRRRTRRDQTRQPPSTESLADQGRSRLYFRSMYEGRERRQRDGYLNSLRCQ